MKYSLLQLTQNILSAMDSDEVNSIEDTTESRQVAEVIRTAYFNIVARADPNEHKQIFSLTDSGDNIYPTVMYKPDNVRRIDWIKYNKEKDPDLIDNYSYVTILPNQQFYDLMHHLNPTETNVDSVVLNAPVTPGAVDDHPIYWKNDKAPDYCTILRDAVLIFDSIDLQVDTTLQMSKTLCSGIIYPSFTLSDVFVPDLDEQQFPLLLNEAKSLAFFELKQAPHEKAELESRRQWRTLQRTKSLEKQPWLSELPDFGRRGGRYGQNRWMRER